MTNSVVRMKWNAINRLAILIKVFLNIDPVRIISAHLVKCKNVQEDEHNQNQRN